MSGARWFPAAGSHSDTWTISTAGLLAERKQLADNAAACKRKTREAFTQIRIGGEEMNDSNNIIFLIYTSSNDCTHCTIVELPRGAALSLRQTQETLRLLDSCGANGNMCGLNTARVQPMEKSQMPSCR